MLLVVNDHLKPGWISTIKLPLEVADDLSSPRLSSSRDRQWLEYMAAALAVAYRLQSTYDHDCKLAKGATVAEASGSKGQSLRDNDGPSNPTRCVGQGARSGPRSPLRPTAPVMTNSVSSVLIRLFIRTGDDIIFITKTVVTEMEPSLNV